MLHRDDRIRHHKAGLHGESVGNCSNDFAPHRWTSRWHDVGEVLSSESVTGAIVPLSGLLGIFLFIRSIAEGT